MTVTIFKDATDNLGAHYVSVGRVLDRIKDGSSKELVLKIRESVSRGEDVSKLKQSLPSVIFAGKFDKILQNSNGKDTKRLDECVSKHSGLFITDFDNIDPVQTKERLKQDPYIFACWQSPTNGVKALVKCPANIENHALYYNAFLDRYPQLDPTSKNIGRLCFESYDPDIYINYNSLVWDKTKTEDERQKDKDRQKDKRNNRIIDIAVSMVRASYDGVKHETLLKASNLIGGYVASGTVDEETALKVLTEEITLKKPKDLHQAKQTIKDGIAHGKSRPLHEAKRIEKQQQFTRRSDGSYDFMADEGEMAEYEKAVREGTLEMGLPTGLNKLNEHWMFKKNHLVWFAGKDNTGKSLTVWYLAVLAATFHGWKILIYSKENRDGQVRKKLKEIYIGKSLKEMSEEELRKAESFVTEHFRLMTAKKMHTVEEFLLRAELVYDEGWEYDLLIGEPFNSFLKEKGVGGYDHTIDALNYMQTFKENYSALWACDHIVTAASRNRNKDGFGEVPTKADVEHGQMKPNKVDDFLIIHRETKDPGRRRQTEVHVEKIKDVETGGGVTPKDEPIILLANKDLCGFTCMGQDPIKLYWERLEGKKETPPQSELLNRMGSWEREEENSERPF